MHTHRPRYPDSGMQRIYVAEDRDKNYQRRAKQSISGVAAWVTGVAKSIGISISIPIGLLIFVEEAPSSAREVAGSRGIAGCGALRWGVCFGKT
jgi:hypothetical protein